METPEKIEQTLQQFTGSVNLFIHERFGRRIHLTEGCNYLREAADCYWLFDLILRYQTSRKLMVEDFQVWKLTVENGTGQITCTDGNNNYLLGQNIEFTDFPISEATIWLIDGVAMLPSEY